MISHSDRERLQDLARRAPRGVAVVVAGTADDEALDVVHALVRGGRERVVLAGPFNPLRLRAHLSDRRLYGRVQVRLGPAVELAQHLHDPAALVCIRADAEHGPPRGLAVAWGRLLRTGGYLALWHGTVPAPGALGLTAGYWEVLPAPAGVHAVRRKPTG